MRLFSFLTTSAGAALTCLVFLQSGNAATISITSQTFTGNAPVEGTPTPASSSGSPTFVQSVTGSIPNVELSPYAFNSNGTANAPYSVISPGSVGAGDAIYNIGNSSTFTLLWGSPDTYNVVQFYSGANGTGSLLSTTGASTNSYIGSDLACYTTTCTQTLFDLVTFTYDSGNIGSVKLIDTGQAAFEYGIAATPLPAALPLFAGGLGFLGYLTRRRKKHQSPRALAIA
jgi:hypothetical protein